MRNWPRYIFLCYLFVLGLFVPHSTGEWIPFLWSFQQPTYLLEKDTPWLALYTCDTSQTVCKVNLDFTANIPTDEPSTHYACLVDFWFWVTDQENKCNPGTVEFPVGTWDVHLIIKKISDESIKIDGTFKIFHPDGSIDPLRVTMLREWQSPTYLPQKDDVSLTEYACDSAQSDCKVNLKITPLLDGLVSSLLTCEVSSDFTLVPTSDPCNPNTSVVPTGDHVVNVKILDTVRWTTLQTSSFLLKNTPIDDIIDPLKVTIWLEFQQPTYLLQKNDTSMTEYTCDSAKSECSVNILAVPKLDGAASNKLICRIKTDFGVEEHDCNPDTFIVPTGDHTLTMEVLNATNQNMITTRTIILHWFRPNQSTGGGSSVVPLMDFSAVSIVVQSGLDDTFVCRTSTCQVNLSALVPDGAFCRWNFGSGTFDTQDTDKKCNPWYVYFSENTTVTLTVIDPANSSHTLSRNLQIYRTQSTDATTSTILIQSEIMLQWTLGKNKKITPEGLICETNNGYCTLNFTGAKSTGANRYIWDFWDGQYYNGKNPPKHIFSLWKYHVRLTVFWETGTANDIYLVEVVVGDSAIMIEEECTTCDEIEWGLQITAVFPNPPHADTVEWVEIKNISPWTLNLDSCVIQDDSKEYKLNWFMEPGKTLRLYQMITGLTLGNTRDQVELLCDENAIDRFSWDFPIPEGYIVHREVLYPEPKRALVSEVIDGDTVDVIIEWKKSRVRLLWVDTPETVHPRKPVEKFGQEASNFSKNSLFNQTVWLTFDHAPVDHYGRRLAYIWQCPGAFSESSCQLFNARLITEWYARMERRFEFRRYSDFDYLEKQAKEVKKWLWSDPEVAKSMNELSREEDDTLDTEQQEEYLQIQKDILESCEQDDSCSKDKINWKSMTEKNSTLKITQNKSGKVSIVGHTWSDFPVKLSIQQGETIVPIALHSDSTGKYEYEWFPSDIFPIFIQSTLEKDGDIVSQEKNLILEHISGHFLSPLDVGILLQWKRIKNHIEENGTLYCQSRGTCSVNVTADANRSDDVSYLWIFPDGSVSDKQNPASFKIGYGRSVIILVATDNITGEVFADTLTIRHAPIPKKVHTSSSSKYTLDLKDTPKDVGGGVLIEKENLTFRFFLKIWLLCTIFLFVFIWIRNFR